MKIGHIENKPAVPAGAERPAAKTGTAAPQLAPQQEASAQVELSSTASLLSEDTADFDAEKVARIAGAIREGRFQVNAEVIADKLISNASELLGRPSH